eukprot:gene20542-biopygen6790
MVVAVVSPPKPPHVVTVWWWFECHGSHVAMMVVLACGHTQALHTNGVAHTHREIVSELDENKQCTERLFIILKGNGSFWDPGIKPPPLPRPLGSRELIELLIEFASKLRELGSRLPPFALVLFPDSKKSRGELLSG